MAYSVTKSDGTSYATIEDQEVIGPVGYPLGTDFYFSSPIPVVAVTPANKEFQIPGDKTYRFIPGFQFQIVNSSGNNGTYSTVSSSFNASNTVIIVNESVPSSSDPKGFVVYQVPTTGAGSIGRTSLTIWGKSVVNYGELAAENWLHLLENFSSSTAPLFPITGQLWYDTSVPRVKVYNGTTWTSMGGAGSVNILDDLGDVTINTPLEGHSLTYQSGTWVNAMAVADPIRYIDVGIKSANFVLPTANYNFVAIDISANLQLSFEATSVDAATIVVQIAATGPNIAVTWAGVTWNGGQAPAINTTPTLLTFVTTDGGVNWFGESSYHQKQVTGNLRYFDAGSQGSTYTFLNDQYDYIKVNLTANATGWQLSPTYQQAYYFILDVTKNSNTITWPGNIYWDGGSPPALDTGKNLIKFGTSDYGVTWYGCLAYSATNTSVSSVFTRTGAVVATTGDYTVAQVTGAAPLASPTFTGVPAAPTASNGTNTTQIATTAFVIGQAYAPTASPTFTGIPAAPTAALQTNTTQLATTAFADALVNTRQTVSNNVLTITAGTIVAAQIGTMSASRVFTLPAANANRAGSRLFVIDESGSVTASNTIVVTRASGADTINGGATSTISTAYGALILETDGGNKWTAIQTGSSGSGSTSLLPINSQVGTTYTLVIGDAGKLVEMNNAAANTLTIPPNSSVAFPLETIVSVRMMGVGTTSIAAGAGVTIRTPSSLNLAGQYRTIQMHKRGTDEWCIDGGVA